MTDSQEIILDSPTDWVRKHIESYVSSDGGKGQQWRGYPTLLLTTRGRKTGQLRRTALIYGQDEDNYLVVASNGGAEKNPLWYLNLVDEPQVTLQVGAKIMRGQARTATPDEKQKLWPVMAKIFPTYDQYLPKAAKFGREIPLVIIEPETSDQ